MCCTRLAGSTGRKNDTKNCYLRTIAQLYRAISSQLRPVSTIGKKLLSSNISPHALTIWWTSANYTAEIVSLVWGTPANFNGFRVLAALLHGTLLVDASQIAPFNRGRHLYSAGRPSRWALAHISSFFLSSIFFYLSFFSSPNVSGHRLNVYHTSTYGVALVRI